MSDTFSCTYNILTLNLDDAIGVEP